MDKSKSHETPMASNHSTQHEKAFNLLPGLNDLIHPITIVLDSHGQILSTSDEAVKLFGINSPTTLPTPLKKLSQETVALKKQVTAHSIQIATGIGPTSTFQVNALPVAVSGNVIVILTLTNITGFARLQQIVDRLDRLATIGTLSASMAHEIKNALVAVKTFVELLLEKNKDAELAEIVGRELSRVNNIVRQLLNFGSSTPPTRSRVQLHDVLEHSLRMVQHQLDGKLISLNRSFNASSDSIHGDNHQLEQVFVNLFLNAVDATGANGSLSVHTELIPSATTDITSPHRTGQPHVRVTVADTGTGVSPENLDRLFEPFFTTKSDGTGLGLPITRRIIHEHDGHITVESKPNCGTTFSIMLPVGSHSD